MNILTGEDMIHAGNAAYCLVYETEDEVLKEGLRLDLDGGGTPENVKQLQSFARTLLEN